MLPRVLRRKLFANGQHIYEHDFEDEANVSRNSYLEEIEMEETKGERSEKRLNRMQLEECAICFLPLNTQIVGDEQVKLSKFLKTPCGHKFHKECLVNCLRVKNSCPICRAVLPEYLDD